MKNEEILKRAIAKAKENGYKFPFSEIVLYKNDLIFGEYRWVPSVIFSRDFAKAFWGEEDVETPKDISFIITTKKYGGRWEAGKTYIGISAWQYHLQLMVLAEEPLKYLEKFL